MSKRKHLIDPNYLQDMLVLWKPLKYFFLFPYLGENLRMSHLLEKRQHTLMRACGTSAKVLNQDWYWITLWCIWMQMGFVFSYTVIPRFSRATMCAQSLGKAGLRAWQEGFWGHVLKTYTLWNTTQGCLGEIPAGLALKGGILVPLTGDLNGESSASWWGARRKRQMAFAQGKCMAALL